MRHTATHQPVLSTSTLTGEQVVNKTGQELGEIEDFMLDLQNGRVRYAVLSFVGFLGVGNKLFAIPVEALQIDTENDRLILDIPKSKLENAPGFDKDNWPDMTDTSWQTEVHRFYGFTPYWER